MRKRSRKPGRARAAGADKLVLTPCGRRPPGPGAASPPAPRHSDSFCAPARCKARKRTAGSTVPALSGYKELRPIVLIPDDSELWPGLAIDFALAPLQRKLAVNVNQRPLLHKAVQRGAFSRQAAVIR